MLHAPAQFGSDIGLKMQLWDPEKLQASCDFATQESGGMFQGSDGFGDVGTFGHSDTDQGVLFVGRDLDAGHRGGSDARVRKLVADLLGQLFAKSLRDAFFTMLWQLTRTTPDYFQPGRRRANVRLHAPPAAALAGHAHGRPKR